jgi:glycosyl transferase family 2
LLCAVQYPKSWSLELAFWCSLGFSSLFGLLVIPNPRYLLGYIAFAVLYGVVSIDHAIERGVLKRLRRRTSAESSAGSLASLQRNPQPQLGLAKYPTLLQGPRHSSTLVHPVANLSIVLPAYNEEAVIAETIAGVLAYGRQRGIPLQIIVVNDGSRDRTAAIVEDLRNVHSEIHLVTHGRNKGYGEALRSGFDAASMGWIFLMDADGQFDITQLGEFLPYAEGNDMVIGYRKRRADALHRVIYGWGFTLLMNLLFDMRYEDIDCAFKLFRTSAWKRVQPIASTDHKIFTVEWLWRAKCRGLKIKELPVRHYQRTKGTQTGARLDVISQMLKSLLKLRLQLPESLLVSPGHVVRLHEPADAVSQSNEREMETTSARGRERFVS